MRVSLLRKGIGVYNDVLVWLDLLKMGSITVAPKSMDTAIVVQAHASVTRATLEHPARNAIQIIIALAHCATRKSRVQIDVPLLDNVTI